ncbi:hypothetical protein [Amycolatopsis azurea]|uniref:Uncharacterized protein n=1 Tax=Amycolatopsis azurea DSM 43854 TaxID=1238180 RepID=M2QUP6_9PSEU|nr:hypothetical protein [Amycolatopsis azurea]EMD30236.1 hypothetical protein C791_0222 [Amycolatopsis azurea DSM 43854]
MKLGSCGGRPGYRDLVASRISEASPAWQRVVDELTHRALRRQCASGPEPSRY